MGKDKQKLEKKMNRWMNGTVLMGLCLALCGCEPGTEEGSGELPYFPLPNQTLPDTSDSGLDSAQTELTPIPIGDACTADDECGTGGICLPLPGGYCVRESCSEDDLCPEDGICIVVDGLPTCLDACASNADCRESEGYLCGEDGVCWIPGPEKPLAGESPLGGACEGDNDCSHWAAICQPGVTTAGGTGFVGGMCVIPGCPSTVCPGESFCHEMNGESLCLPICSSDSDCRTEEGYGCFQPGLCLPGCDAEHACPKGYGCEANGCQPQCTFESCPGDQLCSENGLCVDPPCEGDSCGPGWACLPTGVCVEDMLNGPGPNPGITCADLPLRDCAGTATYCGEILPFEPVEGPGYVNYPLNGEGWANQYRSYARRDLIMLIKWATAYVDCMANGWPGGNGKPLGLGDMSEANGAIPGTSVGQPGHPANTHTNGYDMDIAYYQNAGDDNYLKSICEHTIGGAEQYHCVGQPTLLDKWRNALFLGTLMSSPRIRVIGVDGKVGAIMGDTMFALCNDGWIPEDGCKFSNYALAYEVVDEGKGWYHFHHHHQHVSLESLASSSFGLTLEDACLDATCRPVREAVEELILRSVPGIAFSTPLPHERP